MSSQSIQAEPPILGICQWFHYQDYQTVEQALSLMAELDVRHLRTGISWADFYRPDGKAWYDWLFDQLRGLDLLVSVWHTPPSISERNSCSSPPRRLQDYADFIDQIIREYGSCFSDLELWNEPNNRLKWDFIHCDPHWSKFGQMIQMAAHWARIRGKKTILGGMIPVDHHWLRLIKGYGALEEIDVVAIHAFPGMWWSDAPNWDWHSHWQGWKQKLEYIAEHCDGRPVWVTETGFATCDVRTGSEIQLEAQSDMLRQAAAAPAERIYWYCLIDLDPKRAAIEGFHVDENEYHLGLVRHDGSRKPAFAEFQQILQRQERQRLEWAERGSPSDA